MASRVLAGVALTVYRLTEIESAVKRGWLLTLMNGKRPCRKCWQTEPPLDLGVIRAWARTNNLGVRTGSASGLVVIDDDTDDGSAAVMLKLPPTPTLRTGGGGLHHYFKAPAVPIGNSVSKLMPNVDVRGDGGVVVAAGSMHPETGNPYRWVEGLSPDDVQLAPLPTAFVARLSSPDRNLAVPRPPVPARPTSRSSWARSALSNEVERVRSAIEGTRNSTLNLASFALGQIVAGGQLAEDEVVESLTAAAEAGGLDPREIANTICSGLRAGAEHPRCSKPRRSFQYCLGGRRHRHVR